MKKMWSPWRSLYIESFKEKKKVTSCVFCDAVNESLEDADSLLVAKGELTISVLNLYPYNNGHVMVIPKRHLSDFSELTTAEHAEIMLYLDKCVKALKIAACPEGFNIGANIGKAAGAGIDSHLHFHIVPRWNGDTNFMPVLGEIKVISQELIATKNALITALKKV